MREDIGKVALLHAYGGLCADSDVLPNRSEYYQKTLAITVRHPARSQPQWSFNVETKLVIADRGNPILIEWMQYIMNKIESIDYSTIYHNDINVSRHLCLQQFLNDKEKQLHPSGLLLVHHLRHHCLESVAELTSEIRAHAHAISYTSMKWNEENTKYSTPTDGSQPTVDEQSAHQRQPAKRTQTHCQRCSALLPWTLCEEKKKRMRLQKQLDDWADQFNRQRNSEFTKVLFAELPSHLQQQVVDRMEAIWSATVA